MKKTKSSTIMYDIEYTDAAKKELRRLLKQGRKKKLDKIKNCIEKIQEDPRHPGLHTHKYNAIKSEDNRDIFQSYVENKTPGAYRIFWYYGPDERQITIFAITPHP